MPARSEWKGFLQVNQLRVPVKAFSAAKSQPEISLNQLHRDCGERIRQQRSCPRHGPVDSDEIIPGYQVADDCYLPLNPEEIEQLRPDANKAIAVECFVDQQAIDPVYHAGRTLYLVPDGPPGQRPFSVLREGMRTTGRHAFSRIILSRHERLVLLRPLGRLLAMTVIEYPQRVRMASDYESDVAQVTPAERELELAAQLINTMTDSAFELAQYHDRYQDRLSALIERRIAEANLTAPAPFRDSDEQPEETDDSLVALLQASLTAAGVDPATPLPLTGSGNRFLMNEHELDQKLA